MPISSDGTPRFRTFPYRLVITNTATRHTFTEDYATMADVRRRIDWLHNRCAAGTANYSWRLVER